MWTINDKMKEHIFACTTSSIAEEFDTDWLDYFDLRAKEKFHVRYEKFYVWYKALKSPFPQLSEVELIMALMISECVHKLKKMRNIGLAEPMFGIFEQSISRLSAKVGDYTKLETLSKASLETGKGMMLDIADVREELSMIQSVLDEQENVWRRYTRDKFLKFWSDEKKFSIPSNFQDIIESPPKTSGDQHGQSAQTSSAFSNQGKSSGGTRAVPADAVLQKTMRRCV